MRINVDYAAETAKQYRRSAGLPTTVIIAPDAARAKCSAAMRASGRDRLPDAIGRPGRAPTRQPTAPPAQIAGGCAAGRAASAIAAARRRRSRWAWTAIAPCDWWRSGRGPGATSAGARSIRGTPTCSAGPEEQRRFFADPNRYAPVNGGNDVVLAVEQKQAAAGYRKHGVYYAGRVYLFSDEAS